MRTSVAVVAVVFFASRVAGGTPGSVHLTATDTSTLVKFIDAHDR